MADLRAWMKNAFAVEESGIEDLTDAQRDVADKVCREVVRRRMTTPALMFLEMSRPMNYIGAQAMHFFQPIVGAIVDPAGYEVFAGFLEKRASIEYLARGIERMEAECAARDAASADDADRHAPGAA